MYLYLLDPSSNINVTIKSTPDNITFYSGLNLTLDCFITIKPLKGYILYLYSVSTTWMYSDRIIYNNHHRIVYEPYLVRSLEYRSRLTLNSLDISRDEGSYSCKNQVILHYVGLPRETIAVQEEYTVHIPSKFVFYQ